MGKAKSSGTKLMSDWETYLGSRKTTQTAGYQGKIFLKSCEAGDTEFTVFAQRITRLGREAVKRGITNRHRPRRVRRLQTVTTCTSTCWVRPSDDVQ